MSINFKIAALALGVASLFTGQANAAGCDGSIQPTRNGRTVQCYYLPTVTNNRISGEHMVVNYGGTYDYRYGGRGGAIGNYPPVRHR